jgi:hypothetical protein
MADLSVADVMALRDDDDGFLGGGFGWIILIFLFFLGFGGNGFGFGGNNAAAQLSLTNLERDVLNKSADNALAIANVNYQTLLGFKDQQYQLAQCCCDIKNEVLAQNQLTRDLIQSQYIDGLRTAIVDLKTDISNKNQNEFLLNTLGNWYMRPPVNPCTCYNGYGYGGCGNFGCGCN